MLSIPALLVITIVTGLIYLHLSIKWSTLFRRVEKMFPGPKPLPIIGNLFGKPEESFYQLIEFSKTYGRFFRAYFGNKAFIILNDHRDFEAVLSSNVKLDKGSVYQFLYPWIGMGLLTSAGEKWKSRRKLITPAFHFKILESYVDIFNRNGSLLCDKLSEYAGKGIFEVSSIIKLYALDNICETAMKIKINALSNSESTYVRAIKEYVALDSLLKRDIHLTIVLARKYLLSTHIAAVVALRSFNVFLFSDFIFNLSKYKKIKDKALEVIHGTTKKIIKERREEILKKRENTNGENESDEKKHLVFLDILLSSPEGFSLSDQDICDEVNTFMFEGHDTVSSGISFALYALAHNPEVQENAYQEQLAIFGNSDRPPTSSDLQEMKYLDMVLKESQRLYPSVPLIGRQLYEDINLRGGYVLPKGAQLTLFIYQLHRDPEVWPDPDKFNPDNFLPDAVASRSPYAYVPFSAGARNCIGQRFAVMEMKSCLSKILRRFELKPSPNPEDGIKIYGELVLVSKNGVKIRVENRK